MAAGEGHQKHVSEALSPHHCSALDSSTVQSSHILPVSLPVVASERLLGAKGTNNRVGAHNMQLSLCFIHHLLWLAMVLSMFC